MTTKAVNREFLLAVDRRYLNVDLNCSPGFNEMNWETFIADIDRHLIIKEREAFEHDDKAMEIVPYLVLTSELEPDQVIVTSGCEKDKAFKRIGEGRGLNFGQVEHRVTQHGSVMDFEGSIYRALRHTFHQTYVADYAPRSDGSIVKGIFMLDISDVKFQGIMVDGRKLVVVFYYTFASFDDYTITLKDLPKGTCAPMSVLRENYRNARAVLERWPEFTPWSQILIERGLKAKKPAAARQSVYEGVAYFPDARAEPRSPPLTLQTGIPGLSTRELTGGFPGLSITDMFPGDTSLVSSVAQNHAVVRPVPAEPLVLKISEGSEFVPGQIHTTGYLRVDTPLKPYLPADAWDNQRRVKLPQDASAVVLEEAPTLQFSPVLPEKVLLYPLGLTAHQAQEVVRMLEELFPYIAHQVQVADEVQTSLNGSPSMDAEAQRKKILDVGQRLLNFRGQILSTLMATRQE